MPLVGVDMTRPSFIPYLNSLELGVLSLLFASCLFADRLKEHVLDSRQADGTFISY